MDSNSNTEEKKIDNLTGNVIRQTDNSLKECDLAAPNQDPVLLELDQNGIPMGLDLPEKEA